jgi:YD repeat-containing protein
MLRSRRVESTSPDFRIAVVAWDEETGNALRLEYDADGALLRHAIATRFPQEEWTGDVVGETIWYDAQDQELRRGPVHLGRAPFETG